MTRQSFARGALLFLPLGGRAATGNATQAAPDLDTAASVLAAGGGPAGFTTTALIGVLAGANAGDDLALMTRRIGAPAVKSCIAILDFIVAGAQRRLAHNGVRLPPIPDAQTIEGKALAAALYRAGLDPATGRFAADTLLDRLVSQPVRVSIMHDVDARFGSVASALYRGEVRSEMLRLKEAYALSAPDIRLVKNDQATPRGVA